MSIVSYNGVVLPYAHITDFKQEAMADESDTDWHLTKFTIFCQTLINAEYMALLAPDLVQAAGPLSKNPADIMQMIRARLLQRRKTLSVKFNGEELIPQVQQGLPGTVDADNGPKPKYCQLTYLTGTTFLCTYAIEASYWESNILPAGGKFPVQNQTGNNCLYNRWSESHDLDSNQFLTRTRSGKYKIRSDNADGRVADELREDLALLGVPLGFRRTGSKYTVTPDGLAIAYTITDKQQYKQPPDPAFEAEGEYTETTPKPMGAVRYGKVRVRLKGDLLTDQGLLIRTAVAVAANKMMIRGQQINPNPPPGNGAPGFQILLNSSCRIGLYQNDVEVELLAMIAANKPRILGIDAFNTMTTFTPGSPLGSDYVPGYKSRGQTSALLLAAAYWDPSLRNTVMNPFTGQNTTGFPPGTAGKTSEP